MSNSSLRLGLRVDFTFAWDNKNNDNDNDNNDNNDKNNPHLNFVKGTVIGEKEQGVGIRDNVSAGHFQCRKMLLMVTFILAIVSEVKESTYKIR